jgi:valyl-tRNA synthetase
MVKPAYQQPIDATTFKAVINILENNLKILHPFMPFLTEEIWQYIAERSPEEALIIATWPEAKKVNSSLLSDFEYASEVISGIRKIRKEKNIAFKVAIDLSVLNNDDTSSSFDSIISKLGNIEDLSYTNSKIDGALTFRVKSNEYFVPIQGAINLDEEIAKLKEELKYTEGFLKSVQKKLSNERFVNNAPDQVVASERKKEADALSKIQTIKASLENLK